MRTNRRRGHVQSAFHSATSRKHRSLRDPVTTTSWCSSSISNKATMQLTDEQIAATDEAKQLICELCHTFYLQGWVGGTGGGMSIKADNLIVMAPSGVQKERMIPADMFVLDKEGNVLIDPIARPAPYKPPKLSECSPLFMAVRTRLGNKVPEAAQRRICHSNSKYPTVLSAGISAQRCRSSDAQSFTKRRHGHFT